LSQFGWIGLRFLQRKCALGLALARLPFDWLCSAKEQRAEVQVRYLSALSQIDFVGLYGVLNDLLW
jgi:hypothetical protein